MRDQFDVGARAALVDGHAQSGAPSSTWSPGLEHEPDRALAQLVGIPLRGSHRWSLSILRGKTWLGGRRQTRDGSRCPWSSDRPRTRRQTLDTTAGAVDRSRAKVMRTSVPPASGTLTSIDAVIAAIIGKPSPRPGLSARARKPVPSSLTMHTSSSRASRADSETVPEECPSGNACTTELVTASDTQARTSASASPENPACSAKAPAAWRSSATTDGSARPLHCSEVLLMPEWSTHPCGLRADPCLRRARQPMSRSAPLPSRAAGAGMVKPETRRDTIVLRALALAPAIRLSRRPRPAQRPCGDLTDSFFSSATCGPSSY